MGGKGGGKNVRRVMGKNRVERGRGRFLGVSGGGRGGLGRLEEGIRFGGK